MIALSRPAFELRCMGRDPVRASHPCRRVFARVEEPHIQVQAGGTALVCPRCGTLQRFAPATESKAA